MKHTTDSINEIIISDQPELEIDWRDSQEVEIHNFPHNVQIAMELFNLLIENEVKVDCWDFRYENTLRINFLEEYEDEE